MTVALDAAKLFEKYMPEAQALSAQEVKAYRLEIDLAQANVQTGMGYFAGVRDRVAEHLPKENLAALDSITELALAVQYAAMRVEQAVPLESEIKQKVALGWQLRTVLLAGARGLAAAGLLSADEVDAIATGRGTRDMAEDCVNLAELYRTNAAAIGGKHAVTAEQIEQAAAVGSFLMQHLRPRNARPEKEDPDAMVDVRNRLATLLVQRYERLQAVVHYFEGDGWEEKVPALMSRVVKRAKGKTGE